ncbi:hypothetical protein H5410_020173 [Solanum commersonii]|uniref:Uncharacterized protein n=1 Tax=Solanum commersonii TaxID=4109 RepID=A0A9J5ZBP2_SOLCO|nr:hypothetical protein H5410_020173 [Solanum commersonii]
MSVSTRIEEMVTLDCSLMGRFKTLGRNVSNCFQLVLKFARAYVKTCIMYLMDWYKHLVQYFEVRVFMV